MAPITSRSDPRIMPGSPEPRVEIGGELLKLVEKWPDDDCRLERPADGGMVGSVLRMDYKGTRLLYRITGVAHPAFGFHDAVYVAEWPD